MGRGIRRPTRPRLRRSRPPQEIVDLQTRGEVFDPAQFNPRAGAVVYLSSWGSQSLRALVPRGDDGDHRPAVSPVVVSLVQL
jgi:hypothetical protein